MEQHNFSLRDTLKTDESKKALDRLIELGCEECHLSNSIEWLITDFVIWRGNNIPIKPLDSLETALDPKDGKHQITIEELKQISKTADKLKKQILRLIDSWLIHRLRSEGEFGQADILNLASGYSPALEGSKERWVNEMFNGLLTLPEKARRYNQRKKYDTNRYKLLLIEYIESRAGAPNYSLIGTILNDIEPGRFCNESAPEESLKEWYNDQKKKALSESIANPS